MYVPVASQNTHRTCSKRRHVWNPQWFSPSDHWHIDFGRVNSLCTVNTAHRKALVSGHFQASLDRLHQRQQLSEDLDVGDRCTSCKPWNFLPHIIDRATEQQLTKFCGVLLCLHLNHWQSNCATVYKVRLKSFCKVLLCSVKMAYVRISAANTIKQKYNRRRASAPVTAHHTVVKVGSRGARLSDNGVLNYLFPKTKLIKISNLMCISLYCN